MANPLTRRSDGPRRRWLGRRLFCRCRDCAMGSTLPRVSVPTDRECVVVDGLITVSEHRE